MKRILVKLLIMIMMVLMCKDIFIIGTVHAADLEPIAVMVELNNFDANNVGGDESSALLWKRGDADTPSGSGILRVAPRARNKAGTVVRRNHIRLTDGFSTYFAIDIHSHGIDDGRSEPPGADGLAFIIYEADQPKIGKYGSGLGYSTITNSIAVEFDTWKNSGHGDLDNEHVAILVNGVVSHHDQPEGSRVSYPKIRTDLIHAWVDYDDGIITATIGTSDVRSDDANETITRNVGDFLEGKDVFIGFSASTGSAYSHHDVLKWYFKDSYVESGLETTQGTYSQAASTIDIELDNVINPVTATITLRDAVGNIMNNQNLDIYINDIKHNGSFNTGDNGVLNYSFLDNINDGEHVLRVIANGGTSNFKRFATGENAVISTPEEYFYFDPGTGTITGYRDDGPKDVVIPSTIGGVLVTSIEYYAFLFKQLTSVNIPEGVTSIGDYAFYYNQLTSVHIPEGITSIGSHGFDSNELTNVTILNKHVDFGTSVFIWNQANLKIHGFDPSTTKNYAQANGHTFISLDQYTVTFKDHDGSLLKTEVVYNGESATVPNNPTREGYTFAGWDKSFNNVTTDLEVIAQYDINQYTITFDSQGGSTVASQEVDYNDLLVAPDLPVKVGYSFGGWYKEVELSNQWDFGLERVTENTIIYAKWNLGSDTAYKVEHYQQDTVGAEYNLHETEDNLRGITGADVTALYKTYTGFTQNRSHDESVESGKILSDGSLVLKLYYDRNMHTVNFESNGGTSVSDITGVRYGAIISSPITPTKDGSIFLRWYNGADLSDIWNFTSDKVLTDTTLFAKWIDAESIRMTATPNNVAGSKNYSQMFTLHIHNDTVTGSVYASDMSLGGAFNGLNIRTVDNKTSTTVTAEVYGNLDSEGVGTILLDGSKLTTSINPLIAEVTVTLKGISYDGNGSTGGNIPTEDSGYAEGATVTVKENTGSLEKTGYTFIGWNTKADGSGSSYKPNDTFSLSTTGSILYAQWKINRYTIIFNRNGGSAVNGQNIKHGESVAQPQEPTRTGYNFGGWYKNSELNDVWDFYSDVTKEDTMLYAKWSRIPSGGSSGDSGNDTPKLEPDPIPEPIADFNEIEVIINGETQKTGTETKIETEGKIEVKLTVDAEQMSKHIEEAIKVERDNNEVVIPVLNTGDTVKVSLTGDIVKKLENNDFKISVKEENVTYRLSAKDFTIEKLAESMGVALDSLESIEVEMSISKIDSEEIERLTANAKAVGHEIVFEPLQFEITARTTSNEGTVKEVKINRFKNYAERIMEIPEELDPSRISTGVVFNSDGTYSHVPTEVFDKDNKWYAGINSLTNSTYSVIWNPTIIDNVNGHWSEKMVNDMASRLIILEVEDFMPDKAINRAEFATYIVRALGLYREGVQLSEEQELFIDIDNGHSAWKGITIANEWGIVNGYPDGTFRSDNIITREEAMTMYAKAMDIVKLAELDKDRIFQYKDVSEVAPWAYASVNKTLSAGVFNGREKDMIAPKGTFTHAEAATAIRNLLVESGLINK
ncbi:cell wall/surface repeat protein [Alkaliphilus metalliredigens QYMF]|uniref:Cell wall/surface repeat protein n=1 Tax=Alkaliphilus metalliredigens (strain QYMF) TaxID=293826 RepID=A6TP27_ALKMQ|nr:InlB B-repeat-containing protein [Alkaliphilus metalliredigens]ABR47945.1 cell wall/surface repeat protein [Alkaliphilus metalliredigens QYMF]